MLGIENLEVGFDFTAALLAFTPSGFRDLHSRSRD